MSYVDLKSLIDKLDQSNLMFLEYETEEQRVVLSKEMPTAPHMSVPVASEAPQAVAAQAPVTQAPATVSTEASSETPTVSGTPVESPMIGVVYLQPQPDAPTYVKVGDRVEEGDVVCIIEAMKLMNEIQAPKSGIIKEILVENEQVVEFNQPLMIIE